MKKAGDIVLELFRDLYGEDFLEKAKASSDLSSSWEFILAELWPQENPPPAAANSRIRELEQGVLIIEADHPGWIQTLQTKQKELLLAVQNRYPQMEIKGISFKLSRS